MDNLDLEEGFENLIKIVIIGDSGVGKTSLINRFKNNKFDDNLKNTIGVDFINTDYFYENKNYKIQFWDTAGQENYRGLSSIYYKNILGSIIVYDITDKLSFENIKQWHDELIENVNIKEIEILLLGNKIDLSDKREILIQNSETYAKENKMFYLETSAKTNEDNCVDKAFKILLESIIKNYNTNLNKLNNNIGNFPKINKNSQKKINSDNNITKNKQEKKGCC